MFSRYSDRKVYEAWVDFHLMTNLFSVQSLHSEAAALIESKIDMLWASAKSLDKKGYCEKSIEELHHVTMELCWCLLVIIVWILAGGTTDKFESSTLLLKKMRRPIHMLEYSNCQALVCSPVRVQLDTAHSVLHTIDLWKCQWQWKWSTVEKAFLYTK